MMKSVGDRRTQIFCCCRSNARTLGFTLIELMVVVALIAILASIAMPSYLESVARSRRADAQAILTESAQWLERYYSQNNSYDAATAFAASGLLYSPRGSTAEKSYYRVSLKTPEAPFQTFSLTAERANSMSEDGCGDFVLNNVGQRSQVNNKKEDCWSR